MDTMVYTPILSAIHYVTIGIMLNNNAELLNNGLKNATCKHSLRAGTSRSKRKRACYIYSYATRTENAGQVVTHISRL